MNQFMKRLLGFSMGPVLGAVLSLFQTMVLTRIMTEGAYADSGLFQELIVQVPNFLYLGLDQAYTREYNDSSNKKRLLQQAAIIPLIVGVVLLSISFIFARSMSQWLFGSPNYPHILWVSGIWVLATVVERFFLLTIRMEEKAKEYSFYTLLLKINVFVISLGLVLTGMRDFQPAVYGLLIGQLLGDCVLFYRYREFFDVREFVLDVPYLKKMLQFGLPVMIAATLSSILMSISNLFLKEYATQHQRDIYMGTLRIVSLIAILKTSFASFWVPTAYRWHSEGKSIKHYQFISDALLFVLTIVFYGLLIAKSGMVLLLGAKYYESLYIVGLLSFPHIMYTLSETTTLGIVFSRRTHLNIIVSVLSLIPSVLLNMWLTPTYHYIGAAIASCGSYVMFYLARTYLSKLSGFYFSQKKALLSIGLMTLAACLNAFNVGNVLWWTLGLAILTLLVQSSTIQTGISIRRQPKEWNFV